MVKLCLPRKGVGTTGLGGVGTTGRTGWTTGRGRPNENKTIKVRFVQGRN